MQLQIPRCVPGQGGAPYFTTHFPNASPHMVRKGCEYYPHMMDKFPEEVWALLLLEDPTLDEYRQHMLRRVARIRYFLGMQYTRQCLPHEVSSYLPRSHPPYFPSIRGDSLRPVTYKVQVPPYIYYQRYGRFVQQNHNSPMKFRLFSER